MDFSGLTFWEAGMPVVLVAALAVGLPYVLVPRQTRSHLVVMLCMLGTAVCMIIFGAIISNLFDDRTMETPGGGASFFVAWLYLRESLYFGMIWVPILGLIWLGFAQRVERLRGEDMAREGS